MVTKQKTRIVRIAASVQREKIGDILVWVKKEFGSN